MKKEIITATLESCKGVVARVDYLSTERTEVIREYQKDSVSVEYAEMHDLHLAVVEAQKTLESAMNAYILKCGNNRALNFDALRNAIKAFAEKHDCSALVSYFDDKYTADSLSDVYFSVSVLATKVGAIYTDYQSLQKDVFNTRKQRESLKARKARLLAELAKLEEAETGEAK